MGVKCSSAISDISLQSYRGKQDAYAEEEGRGRRRKRKRKGCVMADRYEMDYPLMQRNQYLPTLQLTFTTNNTISYLYA